MFGIRFTILIIRLQMPKLTFDTNIFITHRRIKLPESFYMSVVVLQELVAGADDDATVKKLLNIFYIQGAVVQKSLIGLNSQIF